MRYLMMAAAAVFALSAVPALADQNFIPMGQDYGLGNDAAPPLDSEQSKFNAQVDIYQSEVYNRNLARKQFDSNIFNLTQEQTPDNLGDNDQLDY
ncbi:MAG: hypothetical protein IOC82_02505 [Aestuariivirga sp.]|uniref:hypothetical protein n=1 Tax=Aestuariivirga sp. TaxID=2650926 RepID=UPI0025BBFBB4|nr:hypothetical protein [Aestuariivirga sp.]MCA3559885.1 hypothetical protein [Aestuariivirga sp.]